VSPLLERSGATLDPIREALLSAAREHAEHLRRSAHEAADALRAAARRDADAILAEAVADGERAARSTAALRSSHVRRQAHETVLAQQSAVRAELQRQVAESAAALRTDPRYAELMDRLTELSRAVLGPDAVVSENPRGGVVARSGTRHLDLSLPTLAAQTLESMTSEVSALWTL
jgi:vacuolar-type H+-ATPase subunit E/Vma4